MSVKRKCYTCGIEKPLSWFTTDKRRKDGHGFECKQRRRQYQVRYSQEHPDTIKANRTRNNEKDRAYTNARASLSQLESAVEAWDEWDV